MSSTIELDRINEGMDELADGLAVRQIIEFDWPQNQPSRISSVVRSRLSSRSSCGAVLGSS